MLKHTALQGIHYWSRPQPDRAIDFNGFLWVRKPGNVLVDPMEIDEAELAAINELGGAKWIILTNFDHLRATGPLKKLLGAEVLAPAGEHDRFGPDGALVDHWFQSSADLPDDLGAAIGVVTLHGGKSEVEVALHLREARALVFGDAVRSHESGKLRLLPDPKIADRKLLLESLEPLGELDFDGLLLGDGDNLVYRGRDALVEFLASL